MPDIAGQVRNFNPARLTLARKRRGLTQVALAEALGVQSRTIRYWESGEVTPDDDVPSALARHLKFPQAFFYGPDIEEITPEGVSFRSLSTISAGRRDMALAQGTLALSLCRWLEGKFKLPDSTLPDLRHLAETPEIAAETLRRMWGLGELPIRNIVHLLESKGVRVFSLSVDSKDIDAFSLWSGPTPLVMLNNFKSAERSRFDAAHELAHLVLHRHGPTSNSKISEMQADAFASAFLMPENSIRAMAPRFPTLSSLLSIKTGLGVSLAALVYRLHKLELVTEWQYRSLCMEMGKRRYRALEPNEMPRETSLILHEMLKDLFRHDGIGKNDIAQALLVSASEIDALMFGLTLRAIDGKRIGDPHKPTNDGLSLVK